MIHTYRSKENEHLTNICKLTTISNRDEKRLNERLLFSNEKEFYPLEKATSSSELEAFLEASTNTVTISTFCVLAMN